MIVTDVNVLAAYLIEGPSTPAAQRLRKVDAEWMVPPFWRLEFQGVLWKYVRHGGMPAATASAQLEKAIALFGPNEIGPAFDIVMQDALNWRITVYEAQYIALARAFGVRCVTEDVALQKACPEIAVSIKTFLRISGGGGCRAGAAAKNYKKRIRK